MLKVMFITGCVAGVFTLTALGLLIWSTITTNRGARARARHRQLDTGRCRCGHLSLTHPTAGDGCETCTCVAFRRVRFRAQSVRENALEWVR